jgi:hypothetical protein
MIVFLDTEKLREANQNKDHDETALREDIVWEDCCRKAEGIGTPVADIVEKLRKTNLDANKFLPANNVLERCCDELKRILEAKP